MSHCVYFIRAHFNTKVGKSSIGFCNWKIGRTFNVKRRVAAFQTACPVQLDLVDILACPDLVTSSRVERELHDYFNEQRLQGEWFNFAVKEHRKIAALLECWPIKQTLKNFLDNVPSHYDPKERIPIIKGGFVPIAALHEARNQVKLFRMKLGEAKIAVDGLTERFIETITATSAQSSAAIRANSTGSAPGASNQM